VKILDSLKAKNTEEIALRRAALNWARTPAIKPILDMCEYVRDTYEMTAYSSVSGSTVYVCLAVRELEGLKDEKLEQLLTYLDNFKPAEQETVDYAGNFERDFVFRWNGQHDGLHCYLVVRVEAFFRADSTTCRQVLVGYQPAPTEPVPIYKLECVDPAPVDAPAPEDDNVEPAAPIETPPTDTDIAPYPF
jgi:hypothetical protein